MKCCDKHKIIVRTSHIHKLRLNCVHIVLVFGKYTINEVMCMKTAVVITGVNTNNLPKLSAKEQAELMTRIKNGDKDARDKFAIGNMRLVLSVVQKFKERGVSDDIFQVGCVGLMKAIDNFDISVGVKFSTYAVPMIVGEIKRFMRDNNSIRVSRSLRDIAYNLLKAREELQKDSDREVGLDELAEYIGADIRDVAVAMEAISDPLSLSDPVYNDGDDTIYLGDQVGNPESEDGWMENINLKNALTKLNKREKEIIMLRYYKSKTQMEVSEEIGISQAQVSRLEKNALDVIKKNIT